MAAFLDVTLVYTCHKMPDGTRKRAWHATKISLVSHNHTLERIGGELLVQKDYKVPVRKMALARFLTLLEQEVVRGREP